VDDGDGAFAFVGRETGFHDAGVDSETEVGNAGAHFVLFRLRLQAKILADRIIQNGEGSGVGIGGEYRKRIVKIMRKTPTVLVDKDPVEAFGEEIEVVWGRP
jgi:hypothetical protein